MMTDPIRIQNGIILLIPPNEASFIQGVQGVPASIIQPTGTIQNTQDGGSRLGSSLLLQNQQMGTIEKFIKAEAKTLGAIQIIIGLIHISFGSVSLLISSLSYINVAAHAGYPVWAGLFFIASGFLSVAAEKYLNNCLVKCSVGMNITSAVVASVGIILFVVQLTINPYYPRYDYDYEPSFLILVGTGICVLLLLFTFLEFCISSLAARFMCQAACSSGEDTVVAFVPYAAVGNGVISTENNPPPPCYNHVVDSPSIET